MYWNNWYCFCWFWKKDFKPELAPLNQILRITEYNNPDGSYSTINIESVTKDNNSIVIKTLSSFEEMLYEKEKFITFKFYNSKGNMKLVHINLLILKINI